MHLLVASIFSPVQVHYTCRIAFSLLLLFVEQLRSQTIAMLSCLCKLFACLTSLIDWLRLHSFVKKLLRFNLSVKSATTQLCAESQCWRMSTEGESQRKCDPSCKWACVQMPSSAQADPHSSACIGSCKHAHRHNQAMQRHVNAALTAFDN